LRADLLDADFAALPLPFRGRIDLRRLPRRPFNRMAVNLMNVTRRAAAAVASLPAHIGIGRRGISRAFTPDDLRPRLRE
jgi:hypothetical protein